MNSLTRRDFLVFGSTALGSVMLQCSAAALPSIAGAQNDLEWSRFGRLNPQAGGGSLVVENGFLISKQTWQDVEFSFRARAPLGTEEVQIWAGLRCRDRDSRYVFGLRGGNNDHVYLARYAPEGGDRFLGIAPLNFHPEPGTWYTLRAAMRGNRIHIYVNDETIPRINVADPEALWTEGGVSLGGGWLPVEFDDVRAGSLSPAATASFTQLGDAVYGPSPLDKSALRRQQRSAYQPANLVFGTEPRSLHSLDGDWLFAPVQELAPNAAPDAAEFDDTGWHVMPVPHFWTPTATWLYAEMGFPDLEGLSETKGISDRWYERELDRLNGYTFDWKKTRNGWYRHHIELPDELSGRVLELRFGAIAKISEVWVNGTHVGAHVGMFGEVTCDVTHAVKPGRNVVSVLARGGPDQETRSNQVVGVAVTVEVTDAMLHSLPHGMYPDTAAGIWQTVTLQVTRAAAVKDIYIQPRLDGLSFDLQLRADPEETRPLAMIYTIRDARNHTVLHRSTRQEIRGEEIATPLHITTPVLQPKLWSPHAPNLYFLEIELFASGELMDRHSTRFGFRTFEVQGNRFLLNGKPFWLRGANHFPHALRPNDAELAAKFIQLARAGNVAVTRSHTAPFTQTWLDAADEHGMAVSYEGTWPWLMLVGPLPEAGLLEAWRMEFAALLRQNRNHPSIIFWTVNNEMKFENFNKNKPELLRKKWDVLNGMMKTMRDIDPTRPICCDSSYVRKEVGEEYEQFILPNHIDDGDIDDVHRYYGWYNPSFFHLMQGQMGKQLAWPDRPLISQEMATGYARNDDGHPIRFYLFKHYTPQSMVGPEAYENRDPAIYLRRQAFMTKELAEVFRRTGRDNLAGILHFAYVSWFKDVWNPESIAPFTTYYALQRALAPVLVSAELFGRHFFAGDLLRTRICVANDAVTQSALPETTLHWNLTSSGHTIAQGTVPFPAVPYYANQWIDLEVRLPELLPTPRVDTTFLLTLKAGDSILAENSYDLILATRDWSVGQMPALALYDPQHLGPAVLSDNAATMRLSSLDSIPPGHLLVIAGADQVLAQTGAAEAVRRFAAAGERVLLLHPKAELSSLFPSAVLSYREAEGENVWMKVPEAEAFDGLEPMDLCWFQTTEPAIPRACSGTYRVAIGRPEITALAEVVDRHGYLKKMEDIIELSGSPLVELRIGAGVVLASEMIFSTADRDPIAARLLTNLMRHARNLADA